MYRKFVVAITILALFLGMVVPIPVSAADDLEYEGRICRDLGILKGDTGVVDSAYLRTKPSRLQAAIMFLRLKGKEQAALSYEGSSNFKDAGDIAWKEGRNVLSYLKNHPEFGWIGDGVNFMPYKLIDSRAYYKVLLESLGYKQKNGGIGDFTWEEVLQFAEDKGLERVAAIGSFTVESLAIATVEALQTKLKGSDRKLIEYLVDIGEVDAEAAASLGIYTKEIDVAIREVKAISNSKVQVVFEEAVTASDVDDEALYDIGKLDIKSIDIKNESTVIINTAAMSENTMYTLEFNSKSHSFRGVKKDSNPPRLLEVVCKDSELVELSFDRILDNGSAQNSSTYEITGLNIKSAELDSTNTKVRLRAEGIQTGRSYELKIYNIKNGDGINTKLITKRFSGKKDSSAPKLKKLTILNNVRLRLEFEDSNGLDKTTAQDTGNYSITYSEGTLGIEEVQVKDRDNDGLWETVELVTESQETGKTYTLEIENIRDGSTLGNIISRTLKEKFRGKPSDNSGPKVGRNPKTIGNRVVEIVFNDANALDLETVYDTENYKLEDIDIEEIRLKSTEDLYSERGRTVLLFTSEMERNESYTLEISGIADEFGNVMSENSKKYRFRGSDDDRTPPYITSVECIDSRTIELNFDNILDEVSAENISNYRIDGLSLVTKATLQDNERTVRLTASSLSTDKSHTISLNGIRDISGNVMTNVNVNLYYNGNLNDDDPPEVSYIEALSKSELWIHFDEEVYATAARMKTSDLSFEQVGEVIDEGMTIVMKPSKPMKNEEYTVTSLTGIWDLRSNAYDLEDDLDFYGTDIENDPPEVDGWYQIDVRRFRVIFTEPVRLIGNGVSGIDNPSGVSIQWTAEVNPDEEDTNEAYSTVDYKASKDIPEDREFEFNFTEMAADYAGSGVFDEEDDDHGASGNTLLMSSMEDDDDPYIDYAEGISRTQVQVVFSEAMSVAGSYRITYEDDHNDRREVRIDFVEVDPKDRNRVNIFTKDLMSDDYVYILEPRAAAADIAGNKLDIHDLEVEFAGSSIMSSEYIQGVELLNPDTFKVSKSTRIYNVNSLYELDGAGDVLGENLIESTSRISDNVHKVISKKPLLRDVRYRISVDGIEYKFYGGLTNDNLELDLPERDITYASLNYDRNYVEVYRSNGDKLDTEKGNGCYRIKSHEHLNNGELLYIYVIRSSDNVEIYGTRIKLEGMPTASSSKEITGFSFEGLEPAVEGAVDSENKTISMVVPYGTNVGSLKASFTCSEGAVVKVGSELQTSGQTENDFSREVIYSVYAEDGTVSYYKVRVTVAESKYEKRITSFVLEGYEPVISGAIDEENGLITLELPYGSDVSGLKTAIKSTQGTTLYPESGKVIDLSGPVIYKVTAPDGSSRNYTVKAIVRGSSANLIKSFRFKEVEALETSITAGNENTIRTMLPYGTNLKSLTPLIGLSEHAQIEPESGETRDFSGDVVYTVTAQDGSSRKYTALVTTAKAMEKTMEEFRLEELDPVCNGRINQEDGTILVSVPYGTEVTGLRATFIVSKGVLVSVDGKLQKSGETANDFSSPVKYTLKANDGSAREYTVTVNSEPSSEKKIKSFSFMNPQAAGTIDEPSGSIMVKVPFGTDVTKLVAVFEKSADCIVRVNDVVQVSGVTANDFTNALKYTVTAQDGSAKDYLVSAASGLPSEKKITAFDFYGLEDKTRVRIDQYNRRIYVLVPAHTELSSLVPVFSFVGKAVFVGDVQQKSAVTANDFTGEVVYRVTAEDGSKAEYTVIIKQWSKGW